MLLSLVSPGLRFERRYVGACDLFSSRASKMSSSKSKMRKEKTTAFPRNRGRTKPRARKKYAPPEDGASSHSVTWMTPQLEIVQRGAVKEPPLPKAYKAAQYGSRKVRELSEVYEQPSTTPSEAEIKAPLDLTTGTAHKILATMDWSIQIFWFKAGTPKFIRNYFDRRKGRPLQVPAQGSPNSPRQTTIHRWHDRCATKIQAVFRGRKLRETIESRLEMEKMHVRYRKLQFVHRKIRTLAFINLRPCKQWRERYGPVNQAFYGEPKKKRARFRRRAISHQKNAVGATAPKTTSDAANSTPVSQQSSESSLSSSAILPAHGSSGYAFGHGGGSSLLDSSHSLNYVVPGGGYGVGCPVCAALAIQNVYLRRRATLLFNGYSRFTWHDPEECKDTSEFNPENRKPLRPFRMERLRVKARLTQMAEKTSGEYLQAFRKNKEKHSYAVEAELRAVWLSKQRIAEENILKWREEELVLGFHELNRQRAAEGRLHSGFDGLNDKKGNKRKNSLPATVRSRKGKKASLSLLQKSLTSLSGGASIESSELAQLRFDDLSQSISNVREEAHSEDSEGFSSEAQTKEGHSLEDDESPKQDIANNAKADSTISRHDKNRTGRQPADNEKRPVIHANKSKTAGIAVDFSVREARIRKNENAKVRSLVRRKNLETVVPLPYLRECCARLIQSLARLSFAKRRAAFRRKWRSERLVRLKRLQWVQRDAMWKKGWDRLLREYHEERDLAAKGIQGSWRAHIARGVLFRARRHTAAPMIERWWRGAYVRKYIVPHHRRMKRAEELRRRVYARMSMAGCLFCIQTWYENVVAIKLERQHFHLARQIADQKWVRHCAVKIQSAWREFFYTYVDFPNRENARKTAWLHVSSVEHGRANRRVQRIRSKLHPRLTFLVERLENDGNLDSFSIDLLGDMELWQNPARELVLAVHPDDGELRGKLELEPLSLDAMRAWAENKLKRNILWRNQPGEWVGECRCNRFAREAIHRAGFCRGDVGLPHVFWFPFLHVVDIYYKAVDKMQQQQREVAQALQEKRMIETLSQLILADTADRGSRYGLSHARWQRMGQKGGRHRARMSGLSLTTDVECHEYIRWFMRGRDTCNNCNALLSWTDGGSGNEEGGSSKVPRTKKSTYVKRGQKNRGVCQFCGIKRYEAPTESSTFGVHHRVLLPPLGSRRGLSSRKGITGIGDIKESISELLQHAAFCVYSPAGHWRRLTPKSEVWEEARQKLAMPTERLLISYGINTIGSLWISFYTGQLDSLPGLDHSMVTKLGRLLLFLEEFVTDELNAPEEEEVLKDESQLERDVHRAFGKMGFDPGSFTNMSMLYGENSVIPEVPQEDSAVMWSGLESEDFTASGRMIGLPKSWT